jgi:outer membrane protein TolC
MYRSAGVVVGVVSLALAATARAEHTLTLDDALALARAHNRDLREARARLAQAEAGIEVARAALMPNITAFGRYTHNYKQVAFNFSGLQTGLVGLAQVIQSTTNLADQAAALGQYIDATNAAVAATPPIQIQLSEQLDAAANATVPIIAPWAWYQFAAAKETARAGGATFNVTEANVLVAVAQAYFAAAGTDELVGARQNAIKVANETYEVAKARLSSSVGNPVDVTRAETALVRAKQDLAEAENTRGAAYRSLATLIDTRDDIRVVPQQTQPHEPGETAELVRIARATRPELAADRATIDSAYATSRAAAWRWSPTLSAFGTAQAFNYTGFSGNKYFWAVGLRIDWVIYDGGLRDAQRHIADAQRAEAEAKLELDSDTIADEVANTRSTLETKRKGVIAADRSVALANEALRIVRAQYEAGVAKQLDLLQAQDSLVSAEVGLAQAHFDLSLAELQLARAVGAFPQRR